MDEERPCVTQPHLAPMVVSPLQFWNCSCLTYEPCLFAAEWIQCLSQAVKRNFGTCFEQPPAGVFCFPTGLHNGIQLSEPGFRFANSSGKPSSGCHFPNRWSD